MPKCPKCEAEIDELDWFESVRAYRVLTESGEIIEKDSSNLFDGDPEVQFNCPDCCETICTDYDAAMKFLKEERAPTNESDIISLVPGYEVIITIEGGAVQGWTVPKGVRVVVKDYDTDGADFEGLKKDEDGEYQEVILEYEGENE